MSLLLLTPAHATEITWEDRGGEAIRLGAVTATASTPSGTYYSVTSNGVIAESRDGGMTWETANLSQSNIRFRAVKFFDDTHGVAVGEGYLAYRNGASWNVVSRSGSKMNAVDMSDAHTAHIVCDGGKILVFKLNNASFQEFTLGDKSYKGVSFHDGVGYACGDGGRLAKYADGKWNLLQNPDKGYDWVQYVFRSSGSFTHIVASDRQTAYAMTSDSRLLKTIDGGLSWSERESGTGQAVNSMNLVPGGDIAVAGDGGRSYRLSDGTDRYSVRYYYDELGRIAASQTSRQQAMTPQRYSYICYDAQGRAVESGQIEAQTPPTQALMRSLEFPGNWGARREQVVHTFYDKPQYASVSARFEEGVQENLRGRIASVVYMDEYDGQLMKYDHATHYSYDIHGNVKELLQEDRTLAGYGEEHTFHSLRYDYDLVSGNVNGVRYQSGQPDQFSIFYEYDSENRIQTVKSQFAGEGERQDAAYEYYRHGPLARTVLGNGVQGVDYAYTLQGWMKGMNSDELGKDMGGDGNNGVAADVVGFTLGYNNNDYRPIAKGQTAYFYRAVSEQDMTNLYTGNISRMATALANPGFGSNFGTQVRDFRYDVLNRLKSSKVQGSNAYATAYTYDANGNITGLTRNDASGRQFDNLAYQYEQDAAGNFINNRLLHVNDGNKDAAGSDIKDQGEYAQNDPSKRNYAYDPQGNLISDKAEEIANIEWTATGKVRRITRTPQSRKPDLEFRYDALGNRVSKTVISKPS
ncbi:MAG: hypothetical protein IKZ91_03230, partial [Bacteroidales bacterium]|nr:hypothetical protein [Bacteroidales bacterium]